MGKYKLHCETCDSNDNSVKWVSNGQSDNCLCEKCRTEEKLIRICLKVRDNRDATRIWNWIDHQPEPVGLWNILAVICPWAFHDANKINSIKFTY